uniref:Uncharacterized protein n=1 Tax=Helicotheca tamesis TaxID=374047 RepID=A0A7S2HE83_9STRA|mmetsp:Transcript_17320/g.23861  ORF Transcript_17320/g.23861 Transcript_17320/m.23861 type:complete len:636 (+) Transcript_17320:2-1909(+)
MKKKSRRRSKATKKDELTGRKAQTLSLGAKLLPWEIVLLRKRIRTNDDTNEEKRAKRIKFGDDQQEHFSQPKNNDMPYLDVSSSSSSSSHSSQSTLDANMNDYKYIMANIPESVGRSGRYRCREDSQNNDDEGMTVELENGDQYKVPSNQRLTSIQERAAHLLRNASRNTFDGSVTIDINDTDAKSLTYLPAPDPDEAVIKIDDHTITGSPIHPVTLSTASGVTPRHMCTPDMCAELCPADIGPELGDIVHVKFNEHVTNTVIFAHSSSKDQSVRNIYRAWKENSQRISDAFFAIPNSEQCVDDLAGGVYVPFGYACTPPGPKGCPASFQPTRGGIKHQVPYLRKTARCRQVQELQQMTGKVQGAIAKALKNLRPDAYDANQLLGRGGSDCLCPSFREQRDGGDVWYSNQVIVRQLGLCLGKYSRADAEIALHVDGSDHSSLQPLYFFPYGGKSGLGGIVDGTDLMVFEKDTGGKSCRIRTSIEDCVVVVLMNSATQLHCGAMPNKRHNNKCWSMRIVPFCRNNIVKFIKARQEHGCEGPKAFVKTSKLTRGHVPLLKSDLVDGQGVAIPWEKGKPVWERRLYSANIQKRGNEIDLHYSCGRMSQGWKGEIYNDNCLHHKGSEAIRCCCHELAEK